MADINPTISIITVNVNRLNNPLQKKRLSIWVLSENMFSIIGTSAVSVSNRSKYTKDLVTIFISQ